MHCSLRDQRGETLVEFALAIAVFFTTIFGAISFGLTVWNYNLVSDLAQEGARRAAVCGTSSGLPPASCDVAAFVRSRAVGMTDVSVTFPLGSPSTIAPGSTVAVTVSRTVRPFTSFVPNTSLTVQSTARMITSR